MTQNQNQTQTVKMYPGSSFVYYIPDDLVNALGKDDEGIAELDKSSLPAYKIRVLGHRAWMETQDIGDKLDEYREAALAGDNKKTVAASMLHIELVKKHVTGCDNFPDADQFTDSKFDIEQAIEKDLLGPRHIAHLASAVLSQRSNEDIELELKKKLDSLSVSPTSDAEVADVQDTETAETDQPS